MPRNYLSNYLIFNRAQIRGAQIVDAVRLHKVGFPKHMPLGEFRRRFGLLSNDANTRPGSPVADERRAIEDMLLSVDVDPASYRVGQSQVSRPLLIIFFLECYEDVWRNIICVIENITRYESYSNSTWVCGLSKIYQYLINLSIYLQIFSSFDLMNNKRIIWNKNYHTAVNYYCSVYVTLVPWLD